MTDQRPGHLRKYTPLTIERDDFMMDFENCCLAYNWDCRKKEHPKGPKRHEDSEWASMIKSKVYPHHSDIDWAEYVEWVSNGGGDEYFEMTPEVFIARV